MQVARTDFYHRFIYGQQDVEVMEMTHQNGDLSEIYVTEPGSRYGVIYVMVFKPNGSLIDELHLSVDSLALCEVDS